MDSSGKTFLHKIDLMCSLIKGCEEDSRRNPYMLVKIGSMSFQAPDNSIKYIPQIIDYLIKETSLKEGEIAAKLNDLKAHH